MYIWFEGIAGTCACRGARGDAVWAAGDAVRPKEGSERSRADGTKGWDGNKGDTDSAVIEADLCALYVRSVWNEGMLMAC
jgi:hypothetical protein